MSTKKIDKIISNPYFKIRFFTFLRRFLMNVEIVKSSLVALIPIFFFILSGILGMLGVFLGNINLILVSLIGFGSIGIMLIPLHYKYLGKACWLFTVTLLVVYGMIIYGFLHI